MRLFRRALLVLAATTPVLSASAMSRVQWVSSQPATQSAPTTSSQGLSLGGVSGFRLFACATTGTITKACTLRAYVFSESTNLWARSATMNADGLGHLDWQILAGDVGKACVAFPDQQATATRGRVFYATDGCDALTLYIEAVAP